jgi:Generalcontrol nonderepressible 1 (Gcn1) N-terminal
MPTNDALLSSAIIRDLIPLFAKESHELALTAMAEAFSLHAEIVLRQASMEDKSSKLILSGLTDKRLRVRSTWAVAVARIIWNITDSNTVTPSLIRVCQLLERPLSAAFNEVASNPVQALQNGSLVSGYAISAAAISRWPTWSAPELANFIKAEEIMNATIAVRPKPSFLLNDRIYTKLTSARDQLWAIHALEATGTRAFMDMDSVWVFAAIYFVVNPKASKEVRFAGTSTITQVLVSMASDVRCEAAARIIRGMEEWVRQV